MQPIIVILNLISDFMNLDQEHCYLYSQNWLIPKDEKLCLVASLGSCRIFAANKSYGTDLGELREYLVLRKLQNITLDLFSYDWDEITRRDELLLALRTDRAERLMQSSGFMVTDIPQDFRDLSERDGSRRLYRFNTTLQLHCGTEWNRETDATDSKFKLLTNS